MCLEQVGERTYFTKPFTAYKVVAKRAGDGWYTGPYSWTKITLRKWMESTYEPGNKTTLDKGVPFGFAVFRKRRDAVAYAPPDALPEVAYSVVKVLCKGWCVASRHPLYQLHGYRGQLASVEWIRFTDPEEA